MRSKIAIIMTLAALALCACQQRADNSDGNGPGDADGFGGRRDPPPASQQAAPREQSPTQQ
jgi:hypothetical protein